MINKLCGLFVLSFGALFISFFGFSSSVSAQTSHTDFVLPELMLEYNESCDIEPLNISTSWATFFTQPGYVLPNGQPGIYDSSPSYALDSLTEFIDGVRDDSIDWAVYVTKDGGGTGYNFYRLVYAPKGTFYNFINYNEWDDDRLTNFFARYDTSRIKTIDIRHGVDCVYRVTDVQDHSGLYFPLDFQEGGWKVFINNFIYDYSESAPGYDDSDSPPIPDTYQPPNPIRLKPDYDLSWSQAGLLNVKYLQNSLPHFLTGISYVVVEKMNDDWDGIDENLTSHTENPAGFLNWDYQLPGKGYYMVRIDHNQQIDSPPWEEDDYIVEQWFLQFYYDGKTAGFVSTVGKPTGMIVNDIKNPDSLYNTVEERNPGILDGNGLLAFIIAPLEFIKILPEKAANCQPITFPLFGSDEQLPCVSPMLKSSMPVVVALIQTSMWAFVIYGIAFNLFRLTRDVSNPQKDGIEVTKL